MYVSGAPVCFRLWRSLVAHHTGGVGVAGSNPVSLTQRVESSVGSKSDSGLGSVGRILLPRQGIAQFG